MSIDPQEIIDKINAKIAELQERIGAIGGSSQTGTEGGDFLFGSSFSDSVLDGLGGDDDIFGRFGNDALSGGSGDDFIDGGLGDDLIDGGSGEDTLSGNLGNDFVDGGEDNDLINGGVGNDQLVGGEGDDELSGGPGDDVLLGGTGADILTGVGGAQTGGSPQVDTLIGGSLDDNGFPVFDGAADRYALGDDNGAFYTDAGNSDFAFILGFELGVDSLQLSPVVSHGLLLNSGDTDIFALPSGGAPELIGSVIGVDLTQGQGVVVIPPTA